MRQVRAFVSVAHLKSFTRAATLLHISQPVLTVQIRKLEEILCIRLLDRNSRTVDITRVGRELVPIFQRILHELDNVVVDTRALATQQHGVVRIAALPSFAAGLLPKNNLPVSEGKPQNDVCCKRCNCEQGQCEYPV
jgi:DNA-binding transcriptional LysR family regulator